MRIAQQWQNQIERVIRRHPRWRWPIVALLVVLLMLFSRLDQWVSERNAAPDGTQVLSGFAKVIDGDSLRVDGGEVRLKDIDAPEGRQTCERDGKEWDCGEEARRKLTALIGGQKVTCHSIERDKHNRFLAYCEAQGRSLNEAMVETGMALSYGGYRSNEQSAKASRRGLWAGQFQKPRDWRRERGIGQ
ncbi:MAG: thermonuclease family protein [Hyphomicrobiaceae bacterium]|nr:thermonuclease family protein [Hyphomicrobiaceae bacterium]